MNTKEILEEIKADVKKMLELLENPKKEISNEKPNFNSNLATDKQKYFLKKSGIAVKEGLTKIEASQIIKEIKEKEMRDY